jgi:Helix-turn-helix domain
MSTPIPILWINVEDAIRISGIGRTLLYEMMNDGRLRTAKVGRKRLVSLRSIEELDSARVAPSSSSQRPCTPAAA